MGVVVAGALAGGCALVLDRLALAAEARGWLYWRRSGRRAAMGLGALTELQQLLSPALRHVVEE